MPLRYQRGPLDTTIVSSSRVPAQEQAEPRALAQPMQTACGTPLGRKGQGGLSGSLKPIGFRPGLRYLRSPSPGLINTRRFLLSTDRDARQREARGAAGARPREAEEEAQDIRVCGSVPRRTDIDARMPADEDGVRPEGWVRGKPRSQQCRAPTAFTGDAKIDARTWSTTGCACEMVRRPRSPQIVRGVGHPEPADIVGPNTASSRAASPRGSSACRAPEPDKGRYR